MEQTQNVGGGTRKKDYLLPVSILVAGVLIAGAVIYSNANKTEPAPSAGLGTSPSAENIAPVSGDDYILGDINAPIVVVEYSDLECPYCKNFHFAMKEAMEAYKGEIAWVLRHFPIPELHKKAKQEAYAAECAGELGGNVKFWEYVDAVFAITPSNDGLDLSKLPEIAAQIGLDRPSFESCLALGAEKFDEKISSQTTNALNSGARGTPFSVVIVENGNKYALPGALPFDNPPEGMPSLKMIFNQIYNEL